MEPQERVRDLHLLVLGADVVDERILVFGELLGDLRAGQELHHHAGGDDEARLEEHLL